MILILNTVYNQLLVMSIVSSGLYLTLKLFSAATMRYVTPSWHYYTYTWIYSFLLLPYHKLFTVFDLNFGQNPVHVLPLPYTVTLPSFNNYSFTSLSDKAEQVSNLTSDLLIYLLPAGTLISIVIIVIQNYKLHNLIFGVCHLSNEARIYDILSKIKRELGITKKVRVYTSPYANTPFLYGLINPCIILPDIVFTDEELKHIYFHELTHWKYHDPWLKLLLLFINSLHWFNPIAYIARRDIIHLCELSCDEKIVKPMNNEEKRQYCELMLNVLWNIKDHNTKLLSAFGDKRNVERRIDMILKNQNSIHGKLISMFAVTASLLIITLGTLTVHAAYSNVEPLTLEQIQTASDKTDTSIILDRIISARKSNAVIDKMFDNKNEICVVENGVLYYSKIYNSFEETKKTGEKSFYIKRDQMSGYVSLTSVYRIAGTDKFVANYVGNLSKQFQILNTNRP